MVVPVPCKFLLLLKLLTSTSPCTRSPALRGTTTTPYGLTSPLRGTVEATVLMVPGWINDEETAAPRLAAKASAGTAKINTTANNTPPDNAMPASRRGRHALLMLPIILPLPLCLRRSVHLFACVQTGADSTTATPQWSLHDAKL